MNVKSELFYITLITFVIIEVNVNAFKTKLDILLTTKFSYRIVPSEHRDQKNILEKKKLKNERKKMIYSSSIEKFGSNLRPD